MRDSTVQQNALTRNTVLLAMTPERVTSLVVLLFQIILSTPLVPLENWKLANEATLEERLFPYELCVLRDPVGFDTTKSIHEQDRCKDLTKYSPLDSLSKRCWLGSKQQLGHDGVCLVRSRGCQNLTERSGFYKHWAGMDPPEINASLGYEADFLYAVRDHYFDSIIFTGDSMAVQLAQRLVCGIMRRSASAAVSIFGGKHLFVISVL